jgi:predicted dehydrogenase
MQTFSLLIVGAGKIGAFFDTPGSEKVLTHAHAFSINPGFRLLGFVDADRQQAERAAEVWGGIAFDSIADAFAHEKIDVAIMAVPDDYHYDVLAELASHPLKLVFAEKPLAWTTAMAEDIVELCREHGVVLALNYTRRFVPEFIDLRDRITSGTLGRFLTGTGYYGKGTMHNGSHMIDLLCFLFGEMSVTKTIGAIRDWRDDDPTCSALLETAGGGKFLMQAVDCQSYTLFEMDMLFERGRVRLVDAGFAMEEFDVRDSELYAGYRVLSSGQRCNTGMGSALSVAADCIYRHLAQGKPLPCTGDDGLRALRLCSSILDGLP